MSSLTLSSQRNFGLPGGRFPCGKFSCTILINDPDFPQE